ncbi:MAG: membrane protein [Clostridiaceae bacterium BRH_c20a]|nr:MAG: membrane protein [Clostridiaceae bacterium BRH_c20a]
MSDIVTASKFKWSDLAKKEDWWAIWLGFIVLTIAAISKFTGAFAFKAAKIATWGNEKAPSIMDAFNGQLGLLIFSLIVLGALFALGLKVMGEDVKGFLIAFPVVFILATIAYVFGAQATMKKYIEYAFWALVVGLAVSNTVKTPDWLKPAVKTEYYIKTGLVLMGAEVLFSNVVKFGFYGLGIAWLVTPIVIIFMWYYGTKVLKMTSKPMVIVIATATSVCGVSAAIAAAAASKAKKEDLTFAIGLTLIFTVLMMVFMPMIIKAIGMNELIGGAWMGGTIDSTGAVVLAGETLGPLAGQVSALVKMIQNVLIGLIAFAIAVFFATKVEKDADGPSVGADEIWHRFPKFILGFIVGSIIFSFLVEPSIGTKDTKAILSLSGSWKAWCFCMAFVSIGLESNFKDMAELVQGGKPLWLYVVGQSFNLVLTLLVAWLLLSGVIFPIPVLTV